MERVFASRTAAARCAIRGILTWVAGVNVVAEVERAIAQCVQGHFHDLWGTDRPNERQCQCLRGVFSYASSPTCHHGHHQQKKGTFAACGYFKLGHTATLLLSYLSNAELVEVEHAEGEDVILLQKLALVPIHVPQPDIHQLRSRVYRSESVYSNLGSLYMCVLGCGVLVRVYAGLYALYVGDFL